MASVQPRSIVEASLRPGRHGAAEGAGGVWLRECRDAVPATLVARHGQEAALQAAAQARFGCAPPSDARHVRQGATAFIGIGTGKWLAFGEARGAFADLSAFAAVSDQTSGFVVLEIGGPQVGDALAKGCNLDLHPSVFTAGNAASTAMFYTAVVLWQVDDQPSYRIAVPRSWAPSFVEAFLAGAAEYGVDIKPALGA